MLRKNRLCQIDPSTRRIKRVYGGAVSRAYVSATSGFRGESGAQEVVEEEEEEEDVVEDEEEQEEEEEGGELTHIRTLCMDLSADGSVFEGLQIIYSPFRRRVLFSFDRFIRWRTESRTDRPTDDRSGLLRPVISRPRTTPARTYISTSVTFFSASLAES